MTRLLLLGILLWLASPTWLVFEVAQVWSPDLFFCCDKFVHVNNFEIGQVLSLRLRFCCREKFHSVDYYYFLVWEVLSLQLFLSQFWSHDFLVGTDFDHAINLGPNGFLSLQIGWTCNPFRIAIYYIGYIFSFFLLPLFVCFFTKSEENRKQRNNPILL